MEEISEEPVDAVWLLISEHTEDEALLMTLSLDFYCQYLEQEFF